MIVLWNLQFQLLLHHYIYKEILVLCHCFNDKLCVLWRQTLILINFDHFLDLTLSVVFHFPFLSFLFAKNPFVIRFARQEFTDSHTEKNQSINESTKPTKRKNLSEANEDSSFVIQNQCFDWTVCLILFRHSKK